MLISKPLLGGILLGGLLPFGLSAAAPDVGPGAAADTCSGCTGGGGGESIYEGPGGELYLRIDMEVPEDGGCIGPISIGELTFCIEIPCHVTYLTCWKIPQGKQGVRKINDLVVQNIADIDCPTQTTYMFCGTELTASLEACGQRVEVTATCSDCEY
ncbi:MAG: hypothetical protein AAF682_32415 [Planctomycetota bacterium]